VFDAFEREVDQRGLADVELARQVCFGRCFQGTNVLVSEIPEGQTERQLMFAPVPWGRGGRSAMYNRVVPKDAATVVEEHVIAGKVVRRLIETPTRRTRSASTDGDAE
jgi:(2Fe-2S) ferredoxin